MYVFAPCNCAFYVSLSQVMGKCMRTRAVTCVALMLRTAHCNVCATGNTHGRPTCVLTMCVPRWIREKRVCTDCTWYDDTEILAVLPRKPEQGTGYLGMPFV